MLDSNSLTYEFFHDERESENPKFTSGDSGALYLATDKSGKKYLVKHSFWIDAANEFVGCWLANKMGIVAPRAQLLTPNKKFKTQYAVALEYLKLSPLSAGEYDYYEMAPILILHTLLKNNDSIQTDGTAGHICTYDFSACLSNEGLYLFGDALKLKPKMTLSVMAPLLENCLKYYCASLDFANIDFSSNAERHNLDPIEFNRRAVSAAKKLLDVSEDEYVDMFNELANLYPMEVVNYYIDCVKALQQKIQEL